MQVPTVLRLLQLQQIPLYSVLFHAIVWCAVDQSTHVHFALLAISSSIWYLAGSGATMALVAQTWNGTLHIGLLRLQVAMNFVRLVVAFTIWGVTVGWVVAVMESYVWHGVLFTPIAIIALMSLNTRRGIIAQVFVILVVFTYLAILVYGYWDRMWFVKHDEEGEDGGSRGEAFLLGTKWMVRNKNEDYLRCETKDWLLWLEGVFLASWVLLSAVCELPPSVKTVEEKQDLKLVLRGMFLKMIVFPFTVGVLVPSFYRYEDMGILLGYNLPVHEQGRRVQAAKAYWVILAASLCACAIAEATAAASGIWHTLKVVTPVARDFIGRFELAAAMVLSALIIAIILVSTTISMIWAIHLVVVFSAIISL